MVSLIYLEGGDRIRNMIKAMNMHPPERKQNLRDRKMPDVCVRQQPEESCGAMRLPNERRAAAAAGEPERRLDHYGSDFITLFQ